MEAETLLDVAPEANAEVAPTETPSQEAIATEQSLPVAKQEFKLPDDWTENEGMRSKFTTLEGLAKSYENLERMVGKKGVIPPDENATPEQLEQFYNQLGRPEDPNEYGLEVPEGLDLDTSEFSEVAHKAGLNKRQASDLFKAYSGMIEQGMKAQQEQSVQAKEQAREQLQSLPEFTGANYDKSIALIKQTLQKHDALELAQEPAFANNPKALKLVLDLAKKSGESSNIDGGTIDSGLDIQSKIEQLHNENSKLMKQGSHANSATINKNSQTILHLMSKLHK